MTATRIGFWSSTSSGDLRETDRDLDTDRRRCNTPLRGLSVSADPISSAELARLVASLTVGLISRESLPPRFIWDLALGMAEASSGCWVPRALDSDSRGRNMFLRGCFDVMIEAIVCTERLVGRGGHCRRVLLTCVIEKSEDSETAT